MILTPRQRLLDVLCRDLDAEGWDQNYKVWLVRGTADDEYLEYLADFRDEPEGFFAVMALDQTVGDDATGLVLATEGWSYPPQLRDSFKSAEAFRAYWAVAPPMNHPERIETRHLILVSADGAVEGLLDYRDDTASEWSHMDLEPNAISGNATIDLMRGALGCNEPVIGALRAINDTVIKPIQAAADKLTEAGEPWDVHRISYEFLKALPHHVRVQTVAALPPEIRAQIDAMPEDLRRDLGI